MDAGARFPVATTQQASPLFGRPISAYRRNWHPFDVFLTPTLTQPPRPVGYWDLNEPDYDKYIAKWTDAAFLFPFNLSGLPAVSVPATWTKDDIPIGVQLVGRYGDEATILRLSAQLEQARPWIQRRPSICAGA